MENTNDNGFLPTSYEAPKSSGNYIKLQKGENKLRILSKPIIGWLDWKDKTPYRYRMNAKPSQSFDPTKKIKHFWSMVVWNYKDSSIGILEVTQSSIQGAIQTLSNDADWGTPLSYDIKIIKNGDGMETEYAVNPLPHKAITNEIKLAYEAKKINLEALYEGKDPFANEVKSFTNDSIDAF